MTETDEKKGSTGRGGKRPGSGRKYQHAAPLVTTTIQLLPDMLAALDTLATERGISRASLIREIIARALPKMRE
jgi:hypothetical protein